MTISRKHGIFCIEGEWEKELTDRSTIQPLIEFLSSSDELLPPIHRRVATVESFHYFVKRWKECENHNIGYLSFHGQKGALCLGKEIVSLEQLGDLLKDSCNGKHLEGVRNFV